ncbi:hypothetical protein [Mycolicibacterium llatzerense]|uniref:hypothetical protein n=1 Tax=Mycolicibacterium llatzerense TaxID=280871 RepID=UPI0008DD9CB0|nr:hypothetical protein [Mycolicibacterium llatzerense]
MNDDNTFQRDHDLWQQCRDLLVQSKHKDGEAQRALLHAADLEAEIEDPRLRAEAALLRGRRALAVGCVDDAVDALSRSEGDFIAAGVSRKIGDCCARLALAYDTKQRYPEAISALERARDAFQRSRASVIELIETTESLALQRLRDGGASVAIDELDAALTNLDSALDGLDSDDEADRTRAPSLVRLNLALARAHAAGGDYQRAEQIIRRLAADGDAGLQAQIHETRGYVHASAGRFGRAVPCYAAAESGYAELVAVAEVAATDGRPSLAGEEELSRLQIGLASCSMALGAALGADRNHVDAIGRYQAALAILEQRPSAATKVIECRLNIGSEALADARYEQAAEHLYRVDEILSESTGLDSLRAGCATNIGRLLDHDGDHGAAIGRHREARSLFLSAGMREWAARAGLNLAVSLTHATAAGADLPHGSSPIDELLPALLYLDHMRFQFPTVAARAAWRRTVAGGYQLAFDLADGNPQLVAELIENAVNSGVHSSKPVVAGDDSNSVLQREWGSPGDTPPRSSDHGIGDG